MEDGMSEEAGELRELSDEETEAVSGGIIVVGGLQSISGALESISWAMLNPQPLPPKALFAGLQFNMLG
jgi:hypothetical protein